MTCWIRNTNVAASTTTSFSRHVLGNPISLLQHDRERCPEENLSSLAERTVGLSLQVVCGIVIALLTCATVFVGSPHYLQKIKNEEPNLD